MKSVSTSDLTFLCEVIRCNVTELPPAYVGPRLSWFDQDKIEETATWQTSQMAQYSLTLTADQLHQLIGMVKEHEYNYQVQRRYPQLRAAWMDYRSQVALTVGYDDQFNY